MKSTMHSLLFRILFLVAAAVGGAAVVHAEDLGAIKARMDNRQGAIDAMKSKHVVGENNRGYLEPRASLAPDEEKTVSDENSDRREVYAALAKKTGASPEEVGRHRAQQLALNSKRGVWVQESNGEWKQKP
jgi:uncharacterized protein YdbL (DUF1318 family)